MITPSHIIYNLALLREPGNRTRNLAVVAGAMVPDLLTYIFFFLTYFVFGYSMSEIWDDMYFNSEWRVFINATHSLILWPLGAFIAYLWHKRTAMFFFLSSTVHVVFDFFVHTDDAYAHFWPLTDWRFISPVSYWNPAEYGHIVGLLDCIIILGLLIYLYQTTEQKYVRWSFVVLGILYILLIGMQTWRVLL